MLSLPTWGFLTIGRSRRVLIRYVVLSSPQKENSLRLKSSLKKVITMHHHLSYFNDLCSDTCWVLNLHGSATYSVPSLETWSLDNVGLLQILDVFAILRLGRDGVRGSWGSAYCVSILHWARRQKWRMPYALCLVNKDLVSSATYCSVLVTLGESVAGSSVAPRIGVVHFTTQVCLAQHFGDMHG